MRRLRAVRRLGHVRRVRVAALEGTRRDGTELVRHAGRVVVAGSVAMVTLRAMRESQLNRVVCTDMRAHHEDPKISATDLLLW